MRPQLVFRTSFLLYSIYDPFALSLRLSYGFSLMKWHTFPLVLWSCLYLLSHSLRYTTWNGITRSLPSKINIPRFPIDTSLIYTSWNPFPHIFLEFLPILMNTILFWYVNSPPRSDLIHMSLGYARILSSWVWRQWRVLGVLLEGLIEDGSLQNDCLRWSHCRILKGQETSLLMNGRDASAFKRS